MSITILPQNGLCNRLRVIFSYYTFAQKQNKVLKVIWLKNHLCPGYFDDYFEPINNITFIKEKTSDEKIFYTGIFPHQKYTPSYKHLKLKSEIKEIIDNNIKTLTSPYVAVHIRRTDHAALAIRHNNFTTDKAFMRFINKTKPAPVYVATDNKQTHTLYKNRYKHRIKLPYHDLINGGTGKRKTSLRDSIVDLYICVNAAHFMGSGQSSFSGVIKQLRSL